MPNHFQQYAVQLLVAVMAFSTTIANAQSDIDFDSARTRWDQAKQQTANDYDNYQDQANALRPLKQRVDSAASSLTNARNQVARLRSGLNEFDARIDDLERKISGFVQIIPKIETKLRGLHRKIDGLVAQRVTTKAEVERLQNRKRQIERRIAQLESQPNTNPWRCIAVDRGHEEHRGGHPGTGATEAEAREAALEACKEFHGKCVVRRCNQRPPTELANARQRLQQVNNDLSHNQQKLRNTVNAIQTERQNVRVTENNPFNQLRLNAFAVPEPGFVGSLGLGVVLLGLIRLDPCLCRRHRFSRPGPARLCWPCWCRLRTHLRPKG